MAIFTKNKNERHSLDTYRVFKIIQRILVDKSKIAPDLTADATSSTSQYRDGNRKSSCGIYFRRTHLVSLRNLRDKSSGGLSIFIVDGFCQWRFSSAAV